MIKVIPPIKNSVFLRQHSASVPLRGRGAPVAAVFQLLRHRRIEEGEPDGPDFIQQPSRDAMVDHLESAPLLAELLDLLTQIVGAIGVEVEEVDDGDAGI